jgi:hypothetical protein
MSAGRQINGDVSGGNVVAAVPEGGADAVAAFADGGVGQVDGVEMIFIGLDARDINLNLNDAGVNAIHRCAQGLIEHEVVPSHGRGPKRSRPMKIGPLSHVGVHHTAPVTGER